MDDEDRVLGVKELVRFRSEFMKEFMKFADTFDLPKPTMMKMGVAVLNEFLAIEDLTCWQLAVDDGGM